MISLTKRGALRKFYRSLEFLAERGCGLHAGIMSCANYGKAASLSKDAVIEAISSLDRDFKPNEVEEAVEKAFSDDDGSFKPRKKRKMSAPTPVKKAAKAGKILKEDPERTAKLQADLIEAGGGELDPFGPGLRAVSNPPPDLIPAVPGMEGSEFRGGVLNFLHEAYRPDDRLFIGSGMEGKWRQRHHTKTVADWIAFFTEKLERVKYASSPAEQKQILIALGYEYPFFSINPLTGEPNDKNSFRSDDNVKESDKLPLGQQIALIKGLKLPVVSLTFSGGKSIHALVRADKLPSGVINNKSEWDQKIKSVLFSQIAPLGFDRATSNPARLSRLPGMLRSDTDVFQRLLYLNSNYNSKGDGNV